VVALFTTWIGAMLRPATLVGSLIVLALGRATFGVAQGAGNLAWNLGHNDFASRRMVAVYMGAHVMLTGVRGSFAPFLGMALYAGWNAFTLPGLGWQVPGFAGIGVHLFAVSAVMALAASIGFAVLSQQFKGGAIAPTND
jgi:hypothetical protein